VRPGHEILELLKGKGLRSISMVQGPAIITRGCELLLRLPPALKGSRRSIRVLPRETHVEAAKTRSTPRSPSNASAAAEFIPPLPGGEPEGPGALGMPIAVWSTLQEG
jgi:hypothetical protein